MRPNLNLLDGQMGWLRRLQARGIYRLEWGSGLVLDEFLWSPVRIPIPRSWEASDM